MKKKYLSVITIFFVLFSTFCPGFLYVEAKDQPAACWGPSDMMSQYFDFQHEMIQVLLWSSINQRRFSTSMWNLWLFSNQILFLSWGTSAMDLISSSVLWWVQSLLSSTTTLVVILSMVAASTVGSNSYWLLILLKDRPIVRDYRELMHIENELFDVAYFRSKQVDLTQPIDGSIKDNVKNVISNYAKSWLLKEVEDGELSSAIAKATMSDIMYDLVGINSAMKNFLIAWWQVGRNALENYKGCFWGTNNQYGDCVGWVLQFSTGATTQLSEDYAWIWFYWSCNRMASRVKSTTQKMEENTNEWSQTAEQKIKDAAKRLKKVFAGVWTIDDHFWYWNGKSKGRCNMSEYQMAQLKAYYWNDWTCEDGRDWLVDAKFSMPAMFNDSKVVLELEKQKTTSIIREARYMRKTANKLDKTIKNFNNATTTREKSLEFFRLFWTWYSYSADYNQNLYNELKLIYNWTMDDLKQSQWNATAWDTSYQLIEIKWLLDQIDPVMSWAKWLQDTLQKIADYQCSE